MNNKLYRLVMYYLLALIPSLIIEYLNDYFRQTMGIGAILYVLLIINYWVSHDKR